VDTLIRTGLAVSLAAVFPLMVGFGIEAFYPSPEQPWQQCEKLVPRERAPRDPTAVPLRDPMQDPAYRRCQETAQRAVQIYNRNLFLITTLIGFGAIAAGAVLIRERMGPVAPGLVFGGLFTILYGAARSFGDVDKRWLFLELLAVFVGLILVTRRYLATSRQQSAAP
jgi:hypothetical protein